MTALGWVAVLLVTFYLVMFATAAYTTRRTGRLLGCRLWLASCALWPLFAHDRTMRWAERLLNRIPLRDVSADELIDYMTEREG